jgi:hypothetical protein
VAVEVIVARTGFCKIFQIHMVLALAEMMKPDNAGIITDIALASKTVGTEGCDRQR